MSKKKTEKKLFELMYFQLVYFKKTPNVATS